jgi:hypothetical protein
MIRRGQRGSSWGRRAFACGFVVALATAVAPGMASAGTVTVTSTADNGPGSLREVADGAFNGDRILVPSGTYTVSSAPISVNTAVTIEGFGPKATTIRGDGDNGVFDFNSAGQMELRDLTVTGGGGTSNGGGIASTGSLTLRRVAVVGNRTALGGIVNGGGIDSSGTLVVVDSLIAGNYGYNGGAINFNGSLTIENSTVSGNDAGSFQAGDNGDGGAVNGGPGATVRHSTITGNRAFNGPGSPGGISVANLTVERSVIAGNVALQAGSPATPPVLNDDCNVTTTTSLGSSIEGATTCGLNGPGDLQNTDPQLAPLADNGGATMTHALRLGSPAIDTADAACGAVADQRAVPRPQGRECDVGAFELARCGKVPTTAVGGPLKDLIRGGKGRDVIAGFGGSDRISGAGGADLLCGGVGKDILNGGKGRDRLFGEAGRDTLLGGRSLDRLFGGKGRDRCPGDSDRERGC